MHRYEVAMNLTPILAEDQYNKVNFYETPDLKVIETWTDHVIVEVKAGGMTGAEAVAINYATCRWEEADAKHWLVRHVTSELLPESVSS